MSLPVRVPVALGCPCLRPWSPPPRRIVRAVTTPSAARWTCATPRRWQGRPSPLHRGRRRLLPKRSRTRPAAAAPATPAADGDRTGSGPGRGGLVHLPPTSSSSSSSSSTSAAAAAASASSSAPPAGGRPLRSCLQPAPAARPGG
eukprot:scaffold900_cov430-Prasinococcus_capsulatus_cf.AAC.15